MTIVTRHRTARALVLLPVLSAGLLATAVIGATPHGHAASPAQLATEHITIKASGAHLPKQIPAGILALTLVNDTNGDADASVGRANPGATLAQIKAADAATNANNASSLSGFIRLMHLVTFLGGANAVPAGASETALVDLRTPGTYGVHVGFNNGGGRTTIIRVTPGAGQQATLPATDLTVRLKDMKFLGVPKHLAAGQITLRVTNQGPSVHEMGLVKLDVGKTQKDVLAFMRSPQAQNGPPPAWVHSAGGMDTISAHQIGEVTLTLTPGYYVAMCFMPDVKKGTPHVMEGMITHFTVR